MIVRLYLDTSPIIFAVQRVEPHCTVVAARISQPEISLVTCELAWLETRVKPLKDNDLALLADFELFFQESLDSVLPLDRQIMTKAAEFRAFHRFKTPVQFISRLRSSAGAMCSTPTIWT